MASKTVIRSMLQRVIHIQLVKIPRSRMSIHSIKETLNVCFVKTPVNALFNTDKPLTILIALMPQQQFVIFQLTGSLC